MTDLSKIKTLDELEYQTQRLERRARIQRATIEGHVDFVIREYNHMIDAIDAAITPVRNAIIEYRQTVQLVSRIIKAFIPKKR